MNCVLVESGKKLFCRNRNPKMDRASIAKSTAIVMPRARMQARRIFL